MVVFPNTPTLASHYNDFNRTDSHHLQPRASCKYLAINSSLRTRQILPSSTCFWAAITVKLTDGQAQAWRKMLIFLLYSLSCNICCIFQFTVCSASTANISCFQTNGNFLLNEASCNAIYLKMRNICNLYIQRNEILP